MVKKVEVFEDKYGGLHREEDVAELVEAKKDVRFAIDACIRGDGKIALDDFLVRVREDAGLHKALLLVIS